MSKKMIEVKHLDGTITVESNDKSKKVKHIKRKKNVCDCLDENCPGCFMSCEKCGSKKCGHVCKFYRNFKSCTLEVYGQFENSITHCEFVSDSEDDDDIVNINGDVATTSQVENLQKNTDNNEIEKKYLYVENQAVYSVVEKQENENDLLALNDSKNNVKQDYKKDKFIETADDLEKNTNVDELSSQEIKAKKVGKLYTVLRRKEIKNKSFALNDSKNNVKQDDAKYLYENKLIDIGSINDLVKSEDVNQSDDLTNDNLEKANNVKMLEEIDKGQNDKIKGSIYPSFVDNKKDKFIETADDSEKSINVGNLSSQEIKEKIFTFTLLGTLEHKKELLDLYNGYNNDDSIVKLNNAKSFNETDIKNIEEKYGGDLKTDKLMKMKNNEGKNVDNARKEKKDTEDTSGKINQSVDLKKTDHESFDQTISHKPAKNAETVEFSTNNLTKGYKQ